VVKTSFVGFFPRGRLILDLTTIFLLSVIALISLGGAFGGIRLL
jgi:hypothetical protein